MGRALRRRYGHTLSAELTFAEEYVHDHAEIAGAAIGAGIGASVTGGAGAVLGAAAGSVIGAGVGLTIRRHRRRART